MIIFAVSYDCQECGVSWTDELDCVCNDKCPSCNKEIEPETVREMEV